MTIIRTKEPELDYVTRNEEAKITEVGRVIDGVSLQIETGSSVVIPGYSGSGKSTLAKTLDGILLSSSDTVLIPGTNIADGVRLLNICCEVDMVFQNPGNQIIAGLVEDNVGFGPENLDVPAEEIWQGVGTTPKTVGMTAFRLKSPNHLSGGQKQRVAVAGVVAMYPKCIVLDKPTAMLDPNGRKEVVRTITKLNRNEGVMIVLVTYYMEEVIGADRLVVMNDERVIIDRAPWEAFARVEELKRPRLDVPQATELAYELEQRGVSLLDSILTMEELAEAILSPWKES